MRRADIWFKRLSLVGAGLIGLIASLSTARADIVHTVSFETQPIIIVWGDKPPPKGIVLGAAASEPRRIGSVRIPGPQLFGSGQLVAEAGNVGPQKSHAIKGSERYFHVASNAPFQIDAQLANARPQSNALIDRIRLEISLELSSLDGPAHGVRAQSPHSGGLAAGVVRGDFRLSALSTPTTVYIGNQRTAAHPGSIADQSVRFNIGFSLDGNDVRPAATAPLSDIVFTVYAP